jgi:hypothetical protein
LKKIDAKKRIIFFDMPESSKYSMSNRHNLSSSHRYSRDSSQGTSNSTNGAPSEQDSSPPQASSRGGWGRPNGDNRPQASGGNGWGRPQHASETSSGGWGRSSFQPSSAAVGGGWGRPNPSSHSFASGGAARPSSTPNFACVLIAALLLLPGVTQPIADEFTQSYIQRNVIVDPHTQDDIDRALAEFNQQQQQQRQQKPPAPPEGYTVEYVRYCFCDKYDLPENLQASFDSVVQTIINQNPQKYGQKLEAIIERALLHIHESLSKENGGAIPEHANQNCKEMISDVEQFYQNLRADLVSFDLASEQFVNQFLKDYLRKKPHECVFPIDDRTTGCNKCLTTSSLYTDRHHIHAIFSFFQKIDVIAAVTRKLNLSSPGQIPLSSLPSDIRKLIMAATAGRCGEVPNAFLIVSPPDCLNDKLRAYLNGALITSISQSEIRTYPLTSSEKKEGKISIYMQDKTFTQNTFDKSKVLYAPKMAFSQYTPSNFRSIGIKLGMGETLDWKARGISCSYSPAEMKKTNRNFCRIAQEWGGVPLRVVNDTDEQLSIDEVSEDPSSYPSGPSHNHWGAAAAAP